ncbi:MAG: ABC transporter permease [Acidobacteria bacterium]|nr:ABC transporter permease [Acidobacteriota bacterium]MBK8811233.1 ABC transporter permease [Acidobacteriota bacterium]
MTFDDLKESAVMALATLRGNKLRSSLTILGVTVGVLTVLSMVSIIQGLNKTFAEQIESLGSNTIFISKFSPSFGRPPGQEERQRKELTLDDADAIRNESQSIIGVSPLQRKIATNIRFREKETETPILIGVTPYYEFTHSQYIGYGRFISDTDVRERSNVVILGRDVVKALFENEEPLDKEIKIAGTPFRVIGVMETLGSFFGQSRDNSVFVPITTYQKYYPELNPPETIFVIIVRPRTRAEVASAMDEIRDILRRRRQVPSDQPDNFGLSSQDALLDVYNQLTGATYLVLTAISAVALMIGGIGVMNIMLVSVTERTKEIGIRKAVGATKISILAQFLIEAVILTGIGGIIGLILGELLSFLINAYSPLPAYIPVWAILVGLFVSAGVGIVFGLYPAWKAAKLNPIDALRYE